MVMTIKMSMKMAVMNITVSNDDKEEKKSSLDYIDVLKTMI